MEQTFLNPMRTPTSPSPLSEPKCSGRGSAFQRLPLQQHHHRVGGASAQPRPHRGPGGAPLERPAALAGLPVQHATEAHHAAHLSPGGWGPATAPGQPPSTRQSVNKSECFQPNEGHNTTRTRHECKKIYL